MKKVIIGAVLSLIVSSSYGSELKFVNIGNCTELANRTQGSVCSTFFFGAGAIQVYKGDTFNVTCTFSPGSNMTSIPGDIMLGPNTGDMNITSGPTLTDEWTPLSTIGAKTPVSFTWTGIAQSDVVGTFFAISFNPPSKLADNQTIKVSCKNN